MYLNIHGYIATFHKELWILRVKKGYLGLEKNERQVNVFPFKGQLYGIINTEKIRNVLSNFII